MRIKTCKRLSVKYFFLLFLFSFFFFGFIVWILGLGSWVFSRLPFKQCAGPRKSATKSGETNQITILNFTILPCFT